MFGFGLLLIILGFGSLVMPHLGLQFPLMSMVDKYQPVAGIAAGALGLFIAFFGMRGKKKDKKK